MKSRAYKIQRSMLLLVALASDPGTMVQAYPPAPDHQIYGMVRNEYGDPVMISSATILLTTTGGVQMAGSIVPGLDAGVNYRLAIPMDAGLNASTYRSSALLPNAAFTIKVKIGAVDYVPMELVGNLSRLGKPAGSTRIDMTLGVDSDHDGLPDAWEYDLIDWLGGGFALADIRPNDDADGDGLSNMQEYLAGTYAWDSADGFSLTVKDRAEDGDVMEFLAIIGRSYKLSRSSDMKTWTSVPFTVPAENASLKDYYPAKDVRMLQVHVPVPTNAPPSYSYRATVQ